MPATDQSTPSTTRRQHRPSAKDNQGVGTDQEQPVTGIRQAIRQRRPSEKENQRLEEERTAAQRRAIKAQKQQLRQQCLEHQFEGPDDDSDREDDFQDDREGDDNNAEDEVEENMFSSRVVPSKPVSVKKLTYRTTKVPPSNAKTVQPVLYSRNMNDSYNDDGQSALGTRQGFSHPTRPNLKNPSSVSTTSAKMKAHKIRAQTIQQANEMATDYFDDIEGGEGAEQRDVDDDDADDDADENDSRSMDTPCSEKQSRRKRCHDSYELDNDKMVSEKLVKAQKINEHQGRPRAKDYDDVTQEFLAAATGDYRARICTKAPMPDHQQEIEMLRLSWAYACTKTGINLEMTPQLAKMVTSRGPQVRGELKTKLRPLVEIMFEFSTGHNKAAIKRNRDHAEALKDGNNFAYRTRGDTLADRHGIFKAPIFQKATDIMWFANKHNEGVTFPQHFKPFPIVTLALLLTVIENCIDEWATGIRTDIPFTINEYRPSFEAHLKDLKEFDQHTKEFKLLDKICLKLYNNGRLHSGAAPVISQVHTNLPSAVWRAAIREEQEGSTTEEDDDSITGPADDGEEAAGAAHVENEN
ncbi:hypothetical protein BJ138DRAFT_1114361 [Hygrophoropsis aurantiaca]|uniref:Uncharacterized protein n=1 Tax=Hygrophoropsis aurantiaca TaxID=72124 RepID=A0ACB8AA58_9AGAM|nr:hypothetical protein BJ138DRAFT_1114361 [Hygrophoropsis aurantiaca]